jgi:murein DD-endopeptidase MepM/ murein hydrolase activator NlpD
LAVNKAARLSTLASLYLLSACIPRGGENYDIQSGSDASAPSGQSGAKGNPVILVPEAQILESTPSWNPATVSRNAQIVAGSVYIVRPGDTLYRIGNQSGTGADAIAKANGLTAPFALQAGQKLRIPAGVYHRISAGETGIAIARAYGVAWNDLISLNGLSEPFMLRSGQFLRLPDTALASGTDSGASDSQSVADAFVLDIDAIATGSQPAQAEPGKVASTLSTPIDKPASFGGQFGWPLAGNVVSRFGAKGGGQVNDGVNIAAALGSNVAAAGDGVVVYAGNEIAVYGGLVMIDHGDGWMTAYGHLGKLAVARGTKVKRGHLLGSVGDTGYVSTPQLHFEIRKNRIPVDPLTKLPAR